MVKRPNIEWSPSQDLKTGKVLGHEFKYRSLFAKERDSVIDTNTVVNEMGTRTQDSPKMVREILSKIIVEVPEEMKVNFKEVNGKEWSGSADDIGLLAPRVEDAFATALKDEIGSLGGDDRDL